MAVKNLKPYMIGIAGPSCSGKTALAKYLMKKLGQDNCSVIQLDSYYHDLSHLTPRETDKHNYDHPGALEKNLLIEHIRSIADGNNVYVPVYDYVTHTRTQDNRLQKPMKFILVEGLFTFYWERLRKVFNTTVFISVKDSVCFNRRVARDIKERGVTREYVINQYETTVRPMFNKFIKPTRVFANLIVNGEDLPEKSATSIMHYINYQSL
tara:strand:- start:7096 stop:7725 length:630 start_codon:yes stop_codon:yes gene_type:complete